MSDHGAFVPQPGRPLGNPPSPTGLGLRPAPRPSHAPPRPTQQRPTVAVPPRVALGTGRLQSGLTRRHPQSREVQERSATVAKRQERSATVCSRSQARWAERSAALWARRASALCEASGGDPSCGPNRPPPASTYRQGVSRFREHDRAGESALTSDEVVAVKTFANELMVFGPSGPDRATPSHHQSRIHLRRWPL